MPYDRRRHPPRHPEKSTTVTTTAPGNQIALALIAQDIMFLRRFAHNITAAPDQAVIPIFCMHNYMCLIIHESNRALRHVDPDLADALAYDCAPAIERARHSVKLYDDKYKELDDVGADFRRIIEEHRQDSSTTPGCDWPGPLERDLALWRFRGRLVSTSHAASFFLAFPPAGIQEPGRARSQTACRERGACREALPTKFRSRPPRGDQGLPDSHDCPASACSRRYCHNFTRNSAASPTTLTRLSFGCFSFPAHVCACSSTRNSSSEARKRSYAGSPPNSCSSRRRLAIRPVLISPRRIGWRFGRGVLAPPFAVFLITLEVFAPSRFPIWESDVTTRTDDVGVQRSTGNLHTSTREPHPAATAFQQVSAFCRLVTPKPRRNERKLAETGFHRTSRPIIRRTSQPT